MSANRGIQLIDAILRSGSIKAVQDAGVTPEMLSGPASTALRFIYTFAEQPEFKGCVPERELVPMTEWPGRVENPPSMEYLIAAVRDDFIRTVGRSIAEDMLDHLDRHDESAFDTLMAAKREIAEVSTSFANSAEDCDAIETMLQDLYNYYETLDSSGLSGLPYPWDILNEETLGIQDGDLIVIYGMPKQMKTWVALAILTYAYLSTQARCLLHTPEVNLSRMRRRLASLLSLVDYTDVKNRFRNNPEAMDGFLSYLHELREEEREQNKRRRRLIISTGTLRSASRSPVELLREKIEAYEAKLVVVDSAYYLSEDLDWKAVSKFTKGVKLMAEDLRCGIILTSQENQKAAVKAAMSGKSPGASSIAFSQSFINDCDLALKCLMKIVHRGNRTEQLVSLEVTAARDTRLEGFTINANPGYDFNYYNDSLISLADALDSQKKTKVTSTAPRQVVRPPARTRLTEDMDRRWQNEDE
jgi:replicative DNA helicase